MNDMERCLREFDVLGATKLWAQIAPHLPQPRSQAEAETTLHYARTCAKSLELRPRAYSHRWLTERGLPSGLPDELRPKAERMFPQIVEGVGLASLAAPDALGAELRQAMTDAVEECYADNPKPDPNKVRARIIDARATRARALGVRPK